MASINLSGILRDPLGEVSYGNKIRFTHTTTTGETVTGFRSIETVVINGEYDIDLQYGNVVIETFDKLNRRWINHGAFTINSDTAATSIPGLLGITTPATDEDLLVFQSLVADAEIAKDDAQTAKEETEALFDNFNSMVADAVSETAIPEPDVYLPFGNKIIDTLSGAFSFERDSATGSVNKSGTIETLAVDEPAITSDGLSVYDGYTNYFESPLNPITQTITLNAGTYTLWCIGDGEASTYYGSSTDGDNLTFTSPGEDLTVTITGSLELVNLIDFEKIAPPVNNLQERKKDIAYISMENNLPGVGEPFSIITDVSVPLSATKSHSVFGTTQDVADLMLFRFQGSTSIAFRMYDSASSATSITVAPNIDDNNHRFACVFNGSSISIYVDGVKYDEDSCDGGNLSFDLIYIGETGALNKSLDSTVSNFRIYHRALTDNQIAALGSAE